MTKEEIEKDLLDQLKSKGKTAKFYTDLVNDYIGYVEIKNELKKDIQERGLRYKVTSGNGFTSEKPNESILNLNKITATMLKILQDLDLQTPAPKEIGEDDYM